MLQRSNLQANPRMVMGNAFGRSCQALDTKQGTNKPPCLPRSSLLNLFMTFNTSVWLSDIQAFVVIDSSFVQKAQSVGTCCSKRRRVKRAESQQKLERSQELERSRSGVIRRSWMQKTIRDESHLEILGTIGLFLGAAVSCVLPSVLTI